MSRRQRWGPFVVLCSLWVLSLVLGSLYGHTRYGPWIKYAGIGVAGNAIVYAAIMGRKQQGQ